MEHLPFVRLIASRTNEDCGVCALAMLLGQSYETVLLKMVTGKHPAPHRGGVYQREIIATAKRLHVRLVSRRAWDEEEAVGLLTVERLHPEAGDPVQHMLLLRFGLLFDYDGQVWEPSTYYEQHDYKPVSILMVEGE